MVDTLFCACTNTYIYTLTSISLSPFTGKKRCHYNQNDGKNTKASFDKCVKLNAKQEHIKNTTIQLDIGLRKKGVNVTKWKIKRQKKYFVCISA